MAIAPQDKFTDVGARISAGHFANALARLAAPAVLAEQPAASYYAGITFDPVDPLFILALFFRESNCGRAGVATITHSWGNMRNPPVGAVPYHTYVDPEKGSYLSFADWLDGCIATAEHAASALYRGLTIEQAIHKWAPAGDGANDPEAYVRGVVDFMNEWADQAGGNGGTNVAIPTQKDIGFPVRWHAAADVGPARPLSDVQWFIVHDTEGHPEYDEQVLTDAGGPVESAHALILPNGTLVAMVPLDATAWAPGNDAVAVRSINVELSGFAADGYTDQQYQSLAGYFRWCISQGCTIPATYIGRLDADGGPLPDAPGIIGHQDVPDGSGGWGGVDHHADPGPLFDWGRFTGLIAGGDPIPPANPDFFIPDNPYGQIPVKSPFWNRWNFLNGAGLALPQMGYAKLPERTVNGRRMQRFERGWIGAGDGPDPWDAVMLMPEEWPAE